MVNIVFEGPKGTGKTTAINAVKNIFPGMNVIHSTKDTPNDKEYYDSLLNRKNTIFDRFSLGEMIYPYVYDRDMKMTPKEIINNITSKKLDYVFLTYSSDDALLVNRVRDRDGELSDLEEIEIMQSNQMFIDLYDVLSSNVFEDYPFIFVDVAKENLSDVVEEVLGWWNTNG